MMNKGSNHETPTPIDSSFLENCQVVTASQGHEPSYLPSATGHEAASRTTYRPDNSSAENGFYSNSDYDHIQHADPNIRSVQDSLSSATIASTSSNFGSTKVPPEYNGYTAYPSSGDPYGYASTGYPGHYHNDQHQSSHPYNQPVGAYQNTGAPYQPISSFQNTGSYAGPLSTYYNPDDYQTCGSYQTSGYNHQTNLWSGANYSNYSSYTYTNYTPDNAAYGSTTATANSLQYQQQYKQWVDYYNQTEVTCAPGTENTSVPNTSNVGCPILGISSGHQTLNIQPPLPYAPPWRPQSSLSELPPLQPVAVSTDAYSGCWKQGDPASLNHHVNQLSDLQRHCNANVCYDNVQDKQKSQRFDLQCTATQQVSQNQPSPLQTVSSLDTHRVSKLQIPTNPRIASNLPLGIQKMDKDTSTTSAAAKPAYITVSMPNATDKVLSHDASDSILKPGSFPKSLRGYVERALARCKDDDQMAACQAVLKEMITKATADGTLHTKDWDTESIFPVPLADVAKMNGLQNPESISFLPMHKRSPSRRSKSRWEPVVEEKPVEKQEIVNQGAMKFGSWLHSTEKDRKFQGGRSASKDALSKTGLLEQKTANKSAPKPFKRRRFDGSSAVDNGDDSSDSDKEQSLTTYYSGAIALADTPEERKRRQNRSKRFERGQSHRVEGNNFSRKIVGAGNLYARRASVLLLNKNFEDVGSRAVEDIDWDALTVKGTCQEVEKGYLRLTSAPDPATVRPEDVLGKALVVVQNSQKNYLYKCDQLKSIRQDLTVQRIRNELTVKVYETHARLAIEVGDLPEFNQCQSQLKILYAEGIKGCHMEFAAYNLLCALLHSNNKRDILSSMSRLTDEAKKDEAVKHALAVRAAVTSGNYVLFFRLYKTAPNLNTLLMDLYVEKIRYEAVKCMSRSYRPTFPISYLAKVLGFTSPGVIEGSDEKDTPGLEECVEWLKAHGACLIADNGDMQLDTKASSSSLYMPEPEDAVAHGDASLAVNDFLTRASSQPS